MEFKAKSMHIRQSPRKIRHVVDTVRGKNIAQATKTLSFTNKKAASFILKTINSAVSNCLSNSESVDVDNLFIKSIMNFFFECLFLDILFLFQKELSYWLLDC